MDILSLLPSLLSAACIGITFLMSNRIVNAVNNTEKNIMSALNAESAVDQATLGAAKDAKEAVMQTNKTLTDVANAALGRAIGGALGVNKG
jgi:hypothetical protein